MRQHLSACITRRSQAALVLTILFSMASASPLSAQFENFLVDAPGRVDMVHDTRTDTLFITNSSQILRYDISNNAFMTPISLSGSNLRGLDLSPDGSTLVAADATTVSDQNRVHVIDTKTLNSREIRFTRQSLESGTFVPAFTSNNKFLITSSFAGSGWVPLREVTLGPDTHTELASVRQNTMLTGSADLSAIGYAESNISSGEFGRYRVSDGDFQESGTGWFAFEMGVNRDATQYAVPSFSGTWIYDENLDLIDRISPGSSETAIGVVYSPVADLMYLAWHSFDGSHASIDVYDTNTLELIDVVDPDDQFDWIGNHAFDQGRLEISRDGRLLFATVEGGVRVYATGVPEPGSIAIVIVGLLAFSRRALRD